VIAVESNAIGNSVPVGAPLGTPAANRLAAKGYHQTFVVNDSRGMFLRAGGRTVTYELAESPKG
jgi:hypothetical protein